MNVLIAGGGTGGHLFPGIALAQEVRRRSKENQVLFVGSPFGIEVRAVPKAGFQLELLTISGLRRKGFKELLLGIIRIPLAVFAALRLVRRFKPDVAVSCGGYAAGPAVLAARLLGVPCVVLEQNAIPGMTNRILGRLSKRIIASLPIEGFPVDKVRVLGNPVRADLLPVRDVDYAVSSPLRLLVFGGSQGARALNEVMLKLGPQIQQENLDIEIVHQTGKHDYQRVADEYKSLGITNIRATAFIDDMASAYKDADVVLCRAGATTIAELTVCGRPSILVPFPYAVDDHQTANAKRLEDAGGAVHLAQSELTENELMKHLLKWIASPSELKTMAESARIAGRPDAVRDIADALQEEAKNV